MRKGNAITIKSPGRKGLVPVTTDGILDADIVRDIGVVDKATGMGDATALSTMADAETIGADTSEYAISTPRQRELASRDAFTEVVVGRRHGKD